MIRRAYILILFVFIYGMNLNAQTINQLDANGKKHGLWKKHYSNGKLKYVGSFNHGMEVDTFKFFFESGDLKAINYFRSKGACYSQQFGEGRVLAAEGLYRDRKKDSVWTYYDQQSTLISRESFSNGIKEGELITYFNNNKKAEVFVFQNDRKNGPWTQYFEDGKIKAKGSYKDGMLDGEVIYYNSFSRPSIKAVYSKGLPNGKWYYFNERMEVEREQVYLRGVKLSDTDDEKQKEEEE